MLAAIFSFKQFTLVYLLTGGGPGGATDTLVVRIYQTAFRFHNFPYAATIEGGKQLLAGDPLPFKP